MVVYDVHRFCVDGMRACDCGADEALHGSGSSVSSVVSQTSGAVSSSVVSSRSGIADQYDVGTFHSLTRLQELCESATDMHCLVPSHVCCDGCCD